MARPRRSRVRTGCSCDRQPLDQPASMPARRGIDVEEILEVANRAALDRLEGLIDHRGDAGEGNPAVEEGLDRNLVGCVEYAGCRSTRLAGLARQAQAGEGGGVRLLEGQLAHSG